VSVSAFEDSMTNTVGTVVSYVIKLPIPMYSKERLVSYCVGV